MKTNEFSASFNIDSDKMSKILLADIRSMISFFNIHSDIIETEIFFQKRVSEFEGWALLVWISHFDTRLYAHFSFRTDGLFSLSFKATTNKSTSHMTYVFFFFSSKRNNVIVWYILLRLSTIHTPLYRTQTISNHNKHSHQNHLYEHRLDIQIDLFQIRN